MGLKQQGCEAYHLSPSSYKVKIGAIPPLAMHFCGMVLS